MSKEGSVAPKERVNITYKPATGNAKEEVELPLKLLMLGDYTQRPGSASARGSQADQRRQGQLPEGDGEQKLALNFAVKDKLVRGRGQRAQREPQVPPLSDIEPEAIAKQVPELKKLLELRAALTALKGPLGNEKAFRNKIQEILGDPAQRNKLMNELGLEEGRRSEPWRRDARRRRRRGADRSKAARSSTRSSPRRKMTPGDEGYEVAKRGVQAFIAELVAPKREGEKVDKAFVDALIAEIDVKLSRQIDEILHHPTFQKLESRVARPQVRRRPHRLPREHQGRAPQLLEGRPPRRLRGRARGAEERSLQDRLHGGVRQFGGKPVGAIIANYEFGPGPQDIALLAEVRRRSRRWRTRRSSRPRARSSSA